MRLLLTALLPLLACGSGGSVLVTTEAAPGLPLPGTLAESVAGLQRPLEACYREALAADGSVAGTVRAVAKGSHGVMHVEIEEPAHPALASCMNHVLSDQKRARVLLDGDVIVGVLLTAKFGG